MILTDKEITLLEARNKIKSTRKLNSSIICNAKLKKKMAALSLLQVLRLFLRRVATPSEFKRIFDFLETKASRPAEAENGKSARK